MLTPTPYFQDATVTIHHGDCLEVLRSLPGASVDAVCCDPPYGLEFMGKEWDGADGFRRSLNPNDAGRDNAFGRASRTSPEYRAGQTFGLWCLAWAEECLRVLKPGGHMLAFGGTRTWHRLACAVEDAGFEIRDSIAWMYGSGFPKSLDVSKAIDKAAGAEREVVGLHPAPATPRVGTFNASFSEAQITAPATPDAERWQGWGTALKPAFEPIVVARKPLAGTVAANVLAHGTGALNVDGCRVDSGADYHGLNVTQGGRKINGGNYGGDGGEARRETFAPAAGRWPANVILDESQAEVLDAQSGDLSHNPPARWVGGTETTEGWGNVGKAEPGEIRSGFHDTGGASRFYYVAKADASERVRVGGIAHPTVKPLALMRWLVRLVTPPGGVVLEPFAGSGTTVEACILEGFRCIAIEREADYLPLIKQRIHRRRDPVEAVKATGEDGGLFDLLDGGAA